MTLVVADPGMISVHEYVGASSGGEPSIDPNVLWKRLVDKYEEVAHTDIFDPANRDGVEQDIFSTIVDDFLPHYKKTTDVDVIVSDFGANVVERRNQLVRTHMIRFFSHLAGMAQGVGRDEGLSALFTPAFRASLSNLVLALENGEFKEDIDTDEIPETNNYLLDDVVKLERMFFDLHLNRMAYGVLTMIRWDTTIGHAQPVYPPGFETFFDHAAGLNPPVWREALRAVLETLRIHEELKLDSETPDLDISHQEIELLSIARGAELSHEEGKPIVIPIDGDALWELSSRSTNSASLNSLLPQDEDFFLRETEKFRDRSLLALLDEGMVDDARHLLKLRQQENAPAALGLLIHAAAAHGQLTGLRRMLFDAALRAIIAEILHAVPFKHGEAYEGIGPYGFDGQRVDDSKKPSYYLIPLLDLSEDEQAMQDVVTDINAYLLDYYRRKPHTSTRDGGPTNPSTTPSTPAPSGGGSGAQSAAPSGVETLLGLWDSDLPESDDEGDDELDDDADTDNLTDEISDGEWNNEREIGDVYPDSSDEYPFSNGSSLPSDDNAASASSASAITYAGYEYEITAADSQEITAASDYDYEADVDEYSGDYYVDTDVDTEAYDAWAFGGAVYSDTAPAMAIY